MPEEPRDRRTTLEEILADPPVVHAMDATPSPPMGVWSTEESCYRFLAERCPAGTRTLETGIGLSTVLFVALGADHICCTAGQDEADRLLRHCRARRISVDRLRLEVGSSHQTLPPLEAAGVERDLVLVDGSHAFPLPVVDWFYAAALLPDGGVLVVDDIDLPGVRVLVRFLDQDPRWTSLAGTRKWRAWRRVGGGPLAEDWTEQQFYVDRRDRAVRQVRRVIDKVRHELTRSRRG